MISNINTRGSPRGGGPQTHALNKFPIIYKYFVFGATKNSHNFLQFSPTDIPR